MPCDKTRLERAIKDHYNPETKILDLTGTTNYIVSDEDAKQVAEIIKNKKVDIDRLIFPGAALSDESADFFQDTGIKVFDLANNDFSAKGLETLLKIPGLRWLELRFNTMLSSHEIREVFAKKDFQFPSALQYLGLSRSHLERSLLKKIDDNIRANSIEELKKQLHVLTTTDETSVEENVAIEERNKLMLYKKIFDEAIDSALNEIAGKGLSLTYLNRVGLAHEIIHEATQLSLSTISPRLVKFELKEKEPVTIPRLSNYTFLDRKKENALVILRSYLLKALKKIKELNFSPTTFREKTHIVAHLLHRLIDLEPSQIISNDDEPNHATKLTVPDNDMKRGRSPSLPQHKS